MGKLVCSLLTLAFAGGGGGDARHMETTLQDDAVFLHGTAAQVRSAVRQIKVLGADRLRLTASWSAIAPAARKRKRPKGFDGSDHLAYPQANWLGLDRAVTEARAAGLQVQVDIAFFAPRWAVGRRASREQRHRQRWWPDPDEFARFAHAVAVRYSGGFHSPRLGAVIPAVRLWTTWNEPNETTFLMPQWRRGPFNGWRPISPHIYRTMHVKAYDAIKRVSPDNVVLVGGTSSKGGRRPGRGGVPPLQFLREMACVDRSLAPLRIPECKGFRPIPGEGWSHHPYSRTTPPGVSDPDPDDVPIADLERLSTLLDQLHAKGRLARPMQVFVTEYGYETKPPDPFQIFSPEDQAAYHGWATYLAWKRPDTPMFAQFLLRDVDPALSGAPEGSRARYHDFQTGLYYSDGSPKPAVQAFRTPFWAWAEKHNGHTAVALFGAVRPAVQAQPVTIERRAAGTQEWKTIRTYGSDCGVNGPEFNTDAAGFFLQGAPYEGPASYRFTWAHGDVVERSVEIAVDAAQPAAGTAGG